MYGSYLYWADRGNQSIREVAIFGSNTVTTLVSTGLSNPQDVEVGRNGNYVYLLDRNGTASTIKRVLAYGSHTVDTLAANTADTPMDDPVALALDPDNDFVYWLDEDDNAVRRVATDGASGSFETLTTSAGGTTTDLAVSPGGGSVYWLDNNGNDAKHLFVDGSGSVTDVVNSGLSVPARIRVAEGSETVDGSCITDAGTLDADYASHDWEADIDATCPSAFYTFRLSDAADPAHHGHVVVHQSGAHPARRRGRRRAGRAHRRLQRRIHALRVHGRGWTAHHRAGAEGQLVEHLGRLLGPPADPAHALQAAT